MSTTNTIGINGLQIQTLTDIVAGLSAGLQAIYGPDINLDPNSPDGNMVHLYAQGKLDVLEMGEQIYTSFDPDQAQGAALDARCAINGVIRKGGTLTTQNVSVTLSGAGVLAGIDTSPNHPFTVADNVGNQYQLLATIVAPSAGTYTGLFQSVAAGPVSSLPGTITTIISIFPGVTSCTNAAGYVTLGNGQESDSSLRIRRANSVSLPSKGYLQGLVGALLDVDGVTNAEVLENVGSSTDGNGVPGHSIWAIVSTGPSNLSIVEPDVANAIYVKRNAGCGMKGSVVVPVTQLDSNVINIQFDFATKENLWFRATIAAITGTVDLSYLTAQVLAEFGQSYNIGQAADSSSIVAFLKSIAPNASISAEGVSTDGASYGSLVTPTGKNYQFQISGSSFISLTP